MLPSETSRDAMRLLVEEKVLSAVRRCLGVSSDARKRVEAMDALVDVTTQLPLRNIELWERRIRAEVWDFERKQPKSRWMFLKPQPRVPGWLDMAHGDGFKRERTLRTLNAGAPNGFFFVLALRRLNDWVPQVRAAAREQLPRISDHTDVTYVVDALWATLPHFSQWGRVEDASRRVLLDLVARGAVASMLKTRLIESASGPATAVLTQAGRVPALDPWLLDIASAATQPTVRARAYRALLDGKMAWPVGRRWKWTDKKWCKGHFEPILEERVIQASQPFRKLLAQAVEDRPLHVRRVAAEALIRNLHAAGSDEQQLATRLAGDSHASVAERGRFVLAQFGNV